MSGSPAGKPALYLHGGPGATLGSGGYRRRFDPNRYLVVGIDQRGCGRSRPLAINALDRLAKNTTQTLIADIEAVRIHLGIERWLVSGVSWGTTLALAYAQAHPARVSELVLVAVTTTSLQDVIWITETMGAIFPEAWERFAEAADRIGEERIVDAYARRLATGDAAERSRAARDWNAWEAAHVSLDPSGLQAGVSVDSTESLVFATLVTHYWSHSAFLRNGSEILSRMSRLACIPGVMIHGRHDISGPAIVPWRIHRLWPASRLLIVETEGHGGTESMKQMRLACDAFVSG